MKNLVFSLCFIGAAALLLVGCKERETQPPLPKVENPANPPAGEAKGAVAALQPTQGNNVTGNIRFIPQQDGVKIEGELQGLSPGKHGFHIHEKGDCSAPDASSAGEHFNLHQGQHGSPENADDKRHTGDLGNLEAGADGTARVEIVDKIIKLSGSESIIGKAVVVHAGPDDLSSQPSGNSGPRVACGVIEQKSQ